MKNKDRIIKTCWCKTLSLLMAMTLIVTTIVVVPVGATPSVEGLHQEFKLVSKNSNNEAGNGNSGRSERNIAISGDGRFVAFVSKATNLDPIDDDSIEDAYLRDRSEGTTMCISKLIDTEPHEVSEVDISDDGRYVVFSRASSPPPQEERTMELWVYDRIEEEIHWVSRDFPYRITLPFDPPLPDTYPVDELRNPSISADGSRIVFEVVFGSTPSPSPYIIPDRLVYSIDPDYQNHDYSNYLLVSEAYPIGSGYPALGSYLPVISGDGDYTVFVSQHGRYWHYPTNNYRQVFYRNLNTGRTELISFVPVQVQPLPLPWERRPVGPANGDSGLDGLDISHDGRFVTFASDATNLIEHDNNDEIDIFVRDRDSDWEITRISESDSGEEANSDSYSPSISADGRFIAFHSYANNLDPRDDGGRHIADVFVHDMDTLRTICISIPDPEAGIVHSSSYHPVISINSTVEDIVVAFGSGTRFTSEDTNGGVSDVYVFGSSLSVPDIWVYPDAFDLIAPPGTIVTDVLTIGNEPYPVQELRFDISCTDNSGLGWLSVDTVSGTLSPGQYAEVMVFADATNLDPGIYEEDILVTSNDPDEPSITIPVTLMVNNKFNGQFMPKDIEGGG